MEIERGQTTIIFDFDGTLADSFRQILSVVNELAGDYGFDPITDEKAQEIRNLSSEEIMLLFPMPRWKLIFFIWKAKRLFNKRLADILPFQGIIKTLEELRSRRVAIGILTSNSRKNVSEFLDRNSFPPFNFIVSERNFFGKNKALEKIIRDHFLEKDKVYYVGDETRDILATKKVNLKSIAVTWGFASKELLSGVNPDYIVEKPEEILKII